MDLACFDSLRNSASAARAVVDAALVAGRRWLDPLEVAALLSALANALGRVQTADATSAEDYADA